MVGLLQRAIAKVAFTMLPTALCERAKFQKLYPNGKDFDQYSAIVDLDGKSGIHGKSPILEHFYENVSNSIAFLNIV